MGQNQKEVFSIEKAIQLPFMVLDCFFAVNGF